MMICCSLALVDLCITTRTENLFVVLLLRRCRLTRLLPLHCGSVDVSTMTGLRSLSSVEWGLEMYDEKTQVDSRHHYGIIISCSKTQQCHGNMFPFW
ncbi:hypothetical protein F5B19DRAFT_470063 [Rostrohypoxylon terebratum]|nr:hypothetical protein F5B19DRAFT_470063 [Rostrohypoxylon terebratum]